MNPNAMLGTSPFKGFAVELCAVVHMDAPGLAPERPLGVNAESGKPGCLVSDDTGHAKRDGSCRWRVQGKVKTCNAAAVNVNSNGKIRPANRFAFLLIHENEVNRSVINLNHGEWPISYKRAR